MIIYEEKQIREKKIRVEAKYFENTPEHKRTSAL
jgi:hypothetical protein